MALFIIAGAALQALLFLDLRWKEHRRRLLVVAGLSSLLFVRAPLDPVGLAVAGSWFVFVFSVFFAVGFRDAIMPVVNEQTLLYFTLLFWYGLAVDADLSLPLVRALAWGFTVPSTAVLAACFTPWDPGPRWRYAFMLWFNFVVIGLAYFCFAFEQVSPILRDTDLTLVNGLEHFFLGAGLLFLGVGSVRFLTLLPGNGQRRGLGRMTDPQRLGESHFSKVRVTQGVAWTLFAVEGTLLVLNFGHPWLPAPVLIVAGTGIVPAALGLTSRFFLK